MNSVPSFFRHEDIGNYELSRTFALHLKSYSAIGSFRNLITGILKNKAEEFTDTIIVINSKYAGHIGDLE